MDFCCLFIFGSLLITVSREPLTAHTSNNSDMLAAISDMRSSLSLIFYGFALLLQTLQLTSNLTQDSTLLMPVDQEPSKYPVPPDHIEDILLSHPILIPLSFSELSHFPTGTIVPTGLHGRRIRIQDHGKEKFSVNNARVATPNMCLNFIIKCHGIDTVITYDDYSKGETPDEEHEAGRTPKRSYAIASSSRNF